MCLLCITRQPCAVFVTSLSRPTYFRIVMLVRKLTPVLSDHAGCKTSVLSGDAVSVLYRLVYVLPDRLG